MNDDQTPAPLPVPRPSPCPGLLRIVQALDGGICRIARRRPPGRRPGIAPWRPRRGIAPAADQCDQPFQPAIARRPSREEERLVRRLLDAGLGPRHGSLAGADDGAT
ncbi:hypothetical protein P4114_20030 [Pseudomonas aeruginosa]|nr:hypothetical protein [Pseudomonas aeruginosa]